MAFVCAQHPRAPCRCVHRPRCCNGMVGRSVARSVPRSVARTVGCPFGRSVDRSTGRPVGRVVDRSFGRLVDRSVDRSFRLCWVRRPGGCSVGRSIGRPLGWSWGRSAGRSLGAVARSVDRSVALRPRRHPHPSSHIVPMQGHSHPSSHLSLWDMWVPVGGARMGVEVHMHIHRKGR